MSEFDEALALSRRGFFGAASAALVATLASKRAYSFLTANPQVDLVAARLFEHFNCRCVLLPGFVKLITIDMGFAVVLDAPGVEVAETDQAFLRRVKEAVGAK